MARSDADECRFFTRPDADVQCRLVSHSGEEELELYGNRSGLLSLTNILLWLIANGSRRELISLAELGFVRCEGSLSLCLRLTDETPAGFHGTIRRVDLNESLEWTFSEEELRRVALLIHRLVAKPCHEYDRLMLANGSEFGVQIKMTDAPKWL